MKIISSPFNRIYSFETNENWIVFNLYTKKEYPLDCISFFILLYSQKASFKDIIVSETACKLVIPFDAVRPVFDFLLNNEFLIDQLSLDNHTQQTFLRMQTQWQTNNWDSAFDYFLGTHNIQFVDASISGRNEANERMAQYSLEHPDNYRNKRYSKYLDEINLPSFEEIDKLLYDNSFTHDDTDWIILALAKCCTGAVSSIFPKWNGSPLFHKLNPSGGARHPSEVYLLINKASNRLKEGFYHVQVLPSCLKLLAEKKLDNLYTELLKSGLDRSTIDPKAIFIFTTIFQRNMYRYRESRTFRTLHMDIGHIMTSLIYLAQDIGLNTFQGYWSADYNLKHLSLSSLDECPLAFVSIG
jgi:SagB-type dehydrogenase family enzyme